MIQPLPHAILEDRLFLGNALQAHHLDTLKQCGITHILNVCEHPNRFEEEFAYKTIKVRDMVREDIKSYFDEAATFIEEALGRDDGRVLVHCVQGKSRST